MKAAKRKSLPKSEFGMPKERKYPVDTKGRARAAKSRASEMEHKGKISKSTETKIDRKADTKLGKRKKGK